jgi:EpsI family protein
MNRILTVVILLLATAAVNYALARPEVELPRTALQEFPTVIDDWKLIGNHRFDEAVLKALQVDDYLMRSYANSQGQVIGLYVGYFESQRDGKQNHSPRQCLPGAGWSIAESRTIPLRLASHNQSEVLINLYLMQKDDHKDLYLWWYQSRGRVYANEYLNKLYMVLDSVTMNRTDGALVRVNMPANPDEAKTLDVQLEFVRSLLHILPVYIPS